MAAPEPIGEFDLPLQDSPFVDSVARAEIELGGELDGDPGVAFRRTMGMFATGVTILTTRSGEQVHGMTANAFMSVSLQPPLVLVSIDRRARMCALLHESVRFGVNVLADGQGALSDLFAGRERAEEVQPQWEIVHDTPLVEGALAHVVARVVRSYWGGDHSLFLGQVEYARYGDGTPLLFHGGRYERLVRDERLLASLPRELLDTLLASGSEHVYEDGEAIMEIGDEASILGLVLEGEVRVERPGRSVTLGAGDVIGEIEVLDGGPRIASIHARGRARVLEVERAELLAALRRDPEAAIALVGVLAGRFRELA